MATKTAKEPRLKAATQPTKRERFDDPFGGQLEKEFRRLLGRHNLHLNMLEISAQTFADTLSNQPSEAVHIRTIAKKLGFHSLYPEASFASARTYLVYSHIAYVFSAGDMLCSRIRSTDSMRALKNADADLFNKIDKGDFVRRTLALTVLATMPPENRNVDNVMSQMERIQKIESFALVNYFRLIRNEELHAAGESDQRIAAAWEALPKEQIKARYGTMPSAPRGQLSSQDALLCSKAWQGVAQWLCRHMLNDAEVQVIVKKRFGKLKAQRRDAAVRKFLKLDMLYSPEDVDATMSQMEW